MLIAQISDPHISLQGGGFPLADAAASGLKQAVNHLMSLPSRPDLVIISGDCVNNGARDEYLYFRELLRPLSMPVYVIPGNHDDRIHMLELFGEQGKQPLDGFVQYVIDDWPLRLLALDTHLPGLSEGYLGIRRLEWLEERLAEAPQRPTMIFMHHPPVRIGMTVFDQIGLVDGEEFATIIKRHAQVERIVSGHVHMALVRRFAGTLLATCPSTAHTLLPDVGRPERLAVQQQPAACLLHMWNESAGLISYTSIIGEHGPVLELHDGVEWRS